MNEEIGKGRYGTVYSAKCKTTQQKVAIKHITNFTENDYTFI